MPLVFNLSRGSWLRLMHEKNMFDPYVINIIQVFIPAIWMTIV